MLASANVHAGARDRPRNAQACHSFEKGGPNKVGPDLWGVVGRPVGEPRGLQLLDGAERSSGENWDYDKLNHFLHQPQGLRRRHQDDLRRPAKEQDRADVIAYLRTLADNPVPLPQGG